MKIVETCSCCAEIHLDVESYKSVISAINLSVTGRKNANKRDKDGFFIPANPPEIDKKLRDAHHQAVVSRRVNIEFDVTDTGEFINYRIKE